MTSVRPARSTELMVLLVTILGTGMVYLDQTAVNVALPVIQRDLQADVGGLQWMVDIYILALAVLLLIGGSLGDRYGRVRVYLIGMVLFVASSVAAGLAGTLWFLVAARAVQGVGGALLIPGGFAILNATVAPERRGRMLGAWGAFSPLITISGPLLGGWLVDTVSWRAVFFLNVPLGLLAFFIAARCVPENRDEFASGRRHQRDTERDRQRCGQRDRVPNWRRGLGALRIACLRRERGHHHLSGSGREREHRGDALAHRVPAS